MFLSNRRTESFSFVALVLLLGLLTLPLYGQRTSTQTIEGLV